VTTPLVTLLPSPFSRKRMLLVWPPGAGCRRRGRRLIGGGGAEQPTVPAFHPEIAVDEAALPYDLLFLAIVRGAFCFSLLALRMNLPERIRREVVQSDRRGVVVHLVRV